MRQTAVGLLIYKICLVLVLVSRALTQDDANQPKFNDISNPANSSILLMNSQQYHFVPVGSFFQYSIASWQEGYDVTIAYNAQILSPSPTYNFLVLQTTSNNSAVPYQQFNCYVRAVNEGIGSLMSNCGLTQNAYISPNGLCQNAIKSASEGMFNLINTFLNCTDLQFNYELVLEQQGGQSNKGTMLFVIDNSGLLFNQRQLQNTINIILGFEVLTNIDDEDKATLYLLCGLTGIVILMMIVIAMVLSCKIHRLEKQIDENKKDKAS